MAYCGAMDARSIEEALNKQTHLFYNLIILDFFHFTVYKTKTHVSVSYSRHFYHLVLLQICSYLHLRQAS